jgi:hypothetical protein
MLSPYKITRTILGASRLELPPSMRIDNIFNNSLLCRLLNDPLPAQPAPPPPLAEVVAASDGEYKEYEVDEILDVRTRKARGRKSKGKPATEQFLVR